MNSFRKIAIVVSRWVSLIYGAVLTIVFVVGLCFAFKLIGEVHGVGAGILNLCLELSWGGVLLLAFSIVSLRKRQACWINKLGCALLVVSVLPIVVETVSSFMRSSMTPIDFFSGYSLFWLPEIISLLLFCVLIFGNRLLSKESTNEGFGHHEEKQA